MMKNILKLQAGVTALIEKDEKLSMRMVKLYLESTLIVPDTIEEGNKGDGTIVSRYFNTNNRDEIVSMQTKKQVGLMKKFTLKLINKPEVQGIEDGNDEQDNGL